MSGFNRGSLTNGSTDNDEEDMETGEVSGHQNDVQSDITQTALEMGLDLQLVKRTLQEKKRRTGSEYSRIEDFVQDYFNSNPESNAAQTQDGFRLDLQRQIECKVCMDRDKCMVFKPCSHLVTCQECAEALDRCPICCCDITEKEKIFMV